MSVYEQTSAQMKASAAEFGWALQVEMVDGVMTKNFVLKDGDVVVLVATRDLIIARIEAQRISLDANMFDVAKDSDNLIYAYWEQRKRLAAGS